MSDASRDGSGIETEGGEKQEAQEAQECLSPSEVDSLTSEAVLTYINTEIQSMSARLEIQAEVIVGMEKSILSMRRQLNDHEEIIGKLKRLNAGTMY